ncbi:MAG: radical SAM protein [Promethearchaeota archaeon]
MINNKSYPRIIFIMKPITANNLIRIISMGLSILQSRIIKVPLYVNYDITWKCNLKCKHCYFSASSMELKNKRIELSQEEWTKVFKYHRDLGTNTAVLTGGEPTLRIDVIKEAIKIFPSVQVVSNGVIKLPPFNGYKQPKYWVSIDGTEETHNKIRGVKVFDKVLRTIQVSNPVVATTIMALNYNEINDIVKIAYENGASGLAFLMYTGYPNDPLLLKGNILKKTIVTVLRVMREYGDFIFYSKKMLEAYMSKEFVPYCVFKSGEIKSYYPDGTQKFCVMGNSSLLCSNCGCIIPITAYSIFRKFDSETVFKLKKLFNF